MSTTESIDAMTTVRKHGSKDGRHRISLVEGDTRLPVSTELVMEGLDRGEITVDFDENGRALGIEIFDPIAAIERGSEDVGQAAIFFFGPEACSTASTIAGVRMDHSDQHTIKDLRMGFTPEGKVTWMSIGGIERTDYRRWTT